MFTTTAPLINTLWVKQKYEGNLLWKWSACWNKGLSLTKRLPLKYAVKAQKSLAPFSRFRGSRITTAHEQQCCRFQSYAKTVPSRMKLTRILTKCEPHSWDLSQWTKWSHCVTSDFNSIYMYNKFSQVHVVCCTRNVLFVNVHSGMNVHVHVQAICTFMASDNF